MEDKLERLIESVRERTVLYDTADKGYQNQNFKRKIWEQVAAESGFKTGNEAKIRWEKLRHSMRDALRRRQHSSKEWKYLHNMSFLHPYMQKLRKVDFGAECEAITFEDHDISQEFSQGSNLVEGLLDNEADSDFLQDSTGSPASSSTPNNKNVKTEDNSSFVLINQSIESSDPLLPPLETSQSDPLQHFFLAMYGTTKKMPLSAQHSIKNQIFKIVSDVEGSLLNNTQSETQDGKLISYVNGFAES